MLFYKKTDRISCSTFTGQDLQMPSCCREQNTDCQKLCDFLSLNKPYESVPTAFYSQVFLILSLTEYLNSSLLEPIANGLEEKAQC